MFISFPGAREVCVRQCQSSLHSHGRRYLCREVKMCVYVGRSAEITVTQPFLHTLKRYSARYQQACTTVPEIVKTYLLKTMLGQKLRKLTAKIIRTNQISHFIHENIPVKIVVVATATDAFILFLRTLYFSEILTELPDKRKGSGT